MAHKDADGNVYVWAVVSLETNEISDGDDIREYEDDLYELVEGVEWRKFKLIPAP